MNPHRSTPPRPGPARITLLLLAAVPAAMAYPWAASRDRWVLGAAVAVAVLLLGRWRGLPLTTALRRRAAMPRPAGRVSQGGGAHTGRRPGVDVRVTALLRITPPSSGPVVLPLPLIAGYLDRYGLRADTVRITSRDTDLESGATRRDTWVGLTLSAVENLAALRARSPRIPLSETAEVAARRLGDQLRETGWEAAGCGPDDVPPLLVPNARESWRAVTDATGEYVAAYQINGHAVADLSGTLERIPGCGAREAWTVVEIAGHGDHRSITAGCAFRTREMPSGAAPLPGLTPQHGSHRAALRALHPLSGIRLDGHTDVAAADFAALRWPEADAVAAIRT